MEHYFTNNQNLKSNIKTITYKQDLYDFSFSTDNGIFSKNKLDFGSLSLIDTILSYDRKYEKILDVGCGYGFIGIVLAKNYKIKATLVDINKRAVHLTEINIKQNNVDAECFYSDAYENVSDKYDLIVTNPPIRAGKEVVLNILTKAKEHLLENGDLWYVIRKDQGAKSISKELEKDYIVTLMKKSKGFYIYMAKKR